GKEHFPGIDKLTIGKFDSLTYSRTNHFLTVLKKYYALRMKRAMNQKEKQLDSLTATDEYAAAYEQSRLRFANKSVSDAVKNTASADRIIEYDGRLIQKIYPIYHLETNPRHKFDFSAAMFQPGKYFGGIYFDTLIFNILVIWSMTILLFITLYFDILKRIISFFTRGTRYRKKEKI